MKVIQKPKKLQRIHLPLLVFTSSRIFSGSRQHILLSKYMMDKNNEKLEPIANSADYRQVTGTFSITLSDIFLPMQIIYQS